MGKKINDNTIHLHDGGLSNNDFQYLFKCISKENALQLQAWGYQYHTADRWNTILGEERGEMEKAILENDLQGIHNEAIRLATLALKMVIMSRNILQEGDKNNG